MTNKQFQDCIREIANLVKKGQVLFFVGSGISREEPTLLPTGDSLRDELVESFVDSLSFDQGTANRIKNDFRKAIKNITLEEVSQVMYEHVGDRLLDVLSSIFDDPRIQPNKIHQFLAKSLTYGNVVVTTNYDSIIEKAYVGSVQKKRKEKALWLFYDDTHFDEVNDYLLNIFSGKEDLRLFSNIIKLHGTFQDTRKKRSARDSVITVLSRVGSLSIPKTKVLRKLFGLYHAVFMGYSARDLDVFDALLEILQDKTIFKEGYLSLPMAILGKKNFFEEVDDYRKEIRKEFEEVIPEFALEATILETKADKKVFWIEYSPPDQEPEILTCDTIKDESNPDRLLLIKCGYGSDLGTKVKQAAINFVEELLKAIDDEHSWLLVEQQDSPDEQSLESYRKNKVTNWAKKLPEYTRMLVLADIAEKAREWGLAKWFCERAQSIDINLKAIAETERRLGWYFYQLNRKGDAAKAFRHYQRSLSSCQLLADKFEEARLQSSLGLLYNTRQRELGRDELDTAKTYVECAWDVLKPIIDPTHTVTEGNVTSKEEIERVGNQLVNLSRNLTVEHKRILAKVWGGMAHVYLRRSGDPGHVIVERGRPEIEKDEESRQLLYRAVAFLKATRQLEKEVGAIRDLIQTDHLVGLTLTRLGECEEAIKFHKDWIRKAGLLGWMHEYAQACRNLSVAYAYKGERESEKWIEEAIMTWENLQKITGEDRKRDIGAAKKVQVKISA